jgi:hypothetical protein
MIVWLHTIHATRYTLYAGRCPDVQVPVQGD